MKKLKFHSPVTTGKSKCHKLHVGISNSLCPDLLVHGSPMECVKSDTYLGDVIEATGSNTENIKSRILRGKGVLAQIRKYLDTVSFGSHYFKIALLLRESLFLSSILTNSESWYGLTQSQITDLENLDQIFFRSLFEVPHTVPSVALYLETGSLSIGTILKMKRINYLHYLVNLDNSEMLSKFFFAQWENPVTSDWTLEAKKNLIELGISTDIKVLKKISKNVFKNLVKKQAKSYEFKRLLEIKETKSKMKKLFYPQFKIQEYLLLKKMNTSQARALFKFRVRMAPFGQNFRGGQSIIYCPFCQNHADGQEESWKCVKMNSLMDIEGDYEEIFGQTFSHKLIKTVQNLYTFREEYRKL